MMGELKQLNKKRRKQIIEDFKNFNIPFRDKNEVFNRPLFSPNEKPFDFEREVLRDAINQLNRTHTKANPLMVDYDPNFKPDLITEAELDELTKDLKTGYDPVFVTPENVHEFYDFQKDEERF